MDRLSLFPQALLAMICWLHSAAAQVVAPEKIPRTPRAPVSALEKRIDALILPKVELHNLSQKDALHAVWAQACHIDPSLARVPFKLNFEEANPTPAMECSVTNVPLGVILKCIIQDTPLSGRVTAQGVEIRQHPADDATRLYTQEIPLNMRELRLAMDEVNFLENGESMAHGLLRYFHGSNVSFPEGSALGLDEKRGRLVHRNTSINLQWSAGLVEMLMESVFPKAKKEETPRDALTGDWSWSREDPPPQDLSTVAREQQWRESH